MDLIARMKCHQYLIALLTLFCGSACKQSAVIDQVISKEGYLIYNAKVINVQTGEVMADRCVLVDSARISMIGAYPDLKHLVKEEKQIDLQGKFVIPGLWDMHVHIEGTDLIEDNEILFPVYVAYGITTVRDMASDLGIQVLAWRDDIDQKRLLGPQIFTAGRKLEGLNSIWKGDMEISNETELNHMLDTLEDLKVDLIKITENTLSGSLFLKSVQAAKKRGFRVSGHVPIDLSIHDLADAGFSSIEHASYLLRLGCDEPRIAGLVASGTMTKFKANEYYTLNFNQDTAIRAYRKLAQSGIAVVPTLIGGMQLAYLDETDHSNDEFQQYLTKRFLSKYDWRIERMENDTPEEKKRRKDRSKLIAQQLPFLQSSGVSIIAGSDAAALNTYVYPAMALHQELSLFQEAGLTPLQILQSATINGAKFLGKLESMATIESGKDADMVILNSNPLLDISATLDIEAVVVNGQYLNRLDLDALLEKARLRKIEIDQQRETTGEQ